LDAVAKLAEVFERGLQVGLDSLDRQERELFLIQDFIIEYEMGGLSTYLYNRMPQPEIIDEAIAAMQNYRLSELGPLIREAKEMFTGWSPTEGQAETWEALLRRVDPADRLGEIDKKIGMLDEYGLNMSSIAKS
jgi:hypothetical protein